MRKLALAIALIAGAAMAAHAQTAEENFLVSGPRRAYPELHAEIACAFEQRLPAERAFEEMQRLSYDLQVRGLPFNSWPVWSDLSDTAFGGTDDPMLLAVKATSAPAIA